MKKLEEVNPDGRTLAEALGLTKKQDLLIDVCVLLTMGFRPQKEGQHPPLTEENVIDFLNQNDGSSIRMSQTVVAASKKYESQGEELTPTVYTVLGGFANNTHSNVADGIYRGLLLAYCHKLSEDLEALAAEGIVVSVE
jgi:hypothetical protein